MILSILIPTLLNRESMLKSLLNDIYNQAYALDNVNDIEVIIDDRDNSISTGEKRNDLISRAMGKYIWFIDDDDAILPYSIKEVMNGCLKNVDVITFNGFMTTDGRNREDFVIRLGEQYEKRNGVYYRFPNHICPIKKSLISNIKFPNIFFGEDYAWAKIINDERILKTEHIINKDIYHYKFINNKNV